MKPLNETRLNNIPCLLKSKFRILNNCPLNISIKKVVIFITIITIILFSTSYYKESGDTHAWVIEKNMEYLDSLKTQKMAIDFIEEDYKNHTVLATWPINQMADYYPSYPKRKFKVKLFAGDENITNFDVIIQSSQIHSFYGPKLSKFINKGLFSKDLKLVKRFEIKNKYTEIYENIK
jgi:hypothetical protein